MVIEPPLLKQIKEVASLFQVIYLCRAYNQCNTKEDELSKVGVHGQPTLFFLMEEKKVEGDSTLFS